jgi:hypothetical protein
MNLAPIVVQNEMVYQQCSFHEENSETFDRETRKKEIPQH